MNLLPSMLIAATLAGGMNNIPMDTPEYSLGQSQYTEVSSSTINETDTEIVHSEVTEMESNKNGDYLQQVVDLVNAERAKENLPALTMTDELKGAAQVRAGELAQSYSHTRPDGRSCFSVLEEFGISYRSAGENIAAGYPSPESVVYAWMKSSGHRANIMNPDFNCIGVGYCSGDMPYWVQLFTYSEMPGEPEEPEGPVYPDSDLPFDDIAPIPGNWKYESVKYVYNNGIMNGIAGTNLFDPDAPLNRAMFATVLYRIAGKPPVEYSPKFTDVEAGEYYSDAILWASEQGIVNGYLDGSYGVTANITREQIAKMLYQYAKLEGYDINGTASLDSFTDVEEVSEWAVDYMKWAVDAEMITGKPNEEGTFRLDPKGQATRAECAKMLMKFMLKYQ